MSGSPNAHGTTIQVDAFGGTCQYSTDGQTWNNVSVGDQYSDCTRILIHAVPPSWLRWHRVGACSNTATTQNPGVYHVGTTIGTSAGFTDMIDPGAAIVIHNGATCIGTDNCGLTACLGCVWPDYSNPFALAYPNGTGFQTVMYGTMLGSGAVFWNMPTSSTLSVLRAESPRTGVVADLQRNQWALFDVMGYLVVRGDGQPPGYGPPFYGGCCLPNGACTIVTQYQCVAAGGTYGGDNIGCDPDPCGIVSVDGGASEARPMLGAPAPNPAAEAISFSVVLPEAGRARVQVSDMSGRIVATLIDQELGAGSHSFTWPLRARGLERFPSGVYQLRMEAAGTVQSRMLTVVR